jgi:hypothetical protein
MKGRIAQLALRVLDFVFRAGRSEAENRPEHLVLGAEGEEVAHFIFGSKAT